MKKQKYLAIAIVILIEVLSLCCFIWLSYKTSEWHKTMEINIPIIKEEFGADAVRILPYYTRHFAFYILTSIASGIIMIGNSFLFVYIFKNDFSLSREEREKIANEKVEKRKQLKKEKLQHQLDELNK